MEVSEAHRKRVFYEQIFGKLVAKNIFRFSRRRLAMRKTRFQLIGRQMAK